MLAGAWVQGCNIPEKGPLRPLAKSYKSFIQPAETQIAINSIGSVSREARKVTLWIYPDVISLRVGYPSYPWDPGFWTEYGIYRTYLAMKTRYPNSSGISRDSVVLPLRCSLDHDIFHFRNLQTENVGPDSFHPITRERISANLDGSGILRALTRVAVFSELKLEVDLHSSERSDLLRMLGTTWSLVELLTVDQGVVTGDEREHFKHAPVECGRLPSSASSEEADASGGPKNPEEIEKVITRYKDLTRVWGGAVLADKGRIRPDTVWRTSLREIFGQYFRKEIDEVSLLASGIHAMESMQKWFPGNRRCLAARDGVLESGWVRPLRSLPHHTTRPG